jgi:hypothetical protein
MTSTLFAFAPAGVLGSGSADARPQACAAASAALLGGPVGVPAVVKGSGLPVSVPATGMPARFRGWATEATGVPTAYDVRQHIDLIAQNDGTTLGIHPRGRSTS